MSKRYFVTGTDTEIGKTTVAAGLLCAARQRGLTTAGVKPVAAGCERTADGLRNEDALALQAQCNPPLAYELINPVTLEAAIAPHIAAQEEQVALSAQGLAGACETVFARSADLTLVEGAGGWCVPLNATELLSDVAVAQKLPVVLVVGMRLGCINHALLSCRAIVADGLELAGWVANQVDPEMSRPEENLATLKQLINAPCLGVVPWLEAADAASVARYLDVTPLV
ncbi:ATP-dependent dethiobiotin synthetase BioD [Halopseudomonas oceani]|uniref:ATP-dependent dethiobiotin synthetase BioD n=1 Tax=Halopseudomonas oceani TaxID=1708783 RepID=A0A2P4ETE0_9GAMM|nr:dethiobiotin synthase [Halopseudomonas oceani]POB02515.1 dethiobiotin synthase [Halopseudomonas oceani]GGE48457.1 ATP-dependent dethiobiotin synthetase BioD [Halopseudomonas oceani]